MLVCLLVEVDMFSDFPYNGLANKITLKVDSKSHDSYIVKCLHDSITQNDTFMVTTLLNTSSF